MRVALYVYRQSQRWHAAVSLDLRVDLMWWTGRTSTAQAGGKQNTLNRHDNQNNQNNQADALLLLSVELPLGQAVLFRDAFRSKPEMNQWDEEAWQHWLDKELMKTGAHDQTRGTKRVEQQNGRKSLSNLGDVLPASLLNPTRRREWGFVGKRLPYPYAASRARAGRGRIVITGSVPHDFTGVEISGPSLSPVRLIRMPEGLTSAGMRLLHAAPAGEACAPAGFPAATEIEQLAAVLAGRSLLTSELDQLLRERLPQLAPVWRSAVQAAHLCGRLRLTAAVGPAAERRAGLLRGRPAAPRCRRCGSAVVRTAPCASCGSMHCACCEACLALGRSRACALLVQGSALNAAAAQGHAAAPGPTGGLDRWGLSPAQREAAGAALQFLAAPASTAAGRRFLLWAVTGAGKTEMIFPLLRYVLDRGGTALVATPRRDVVIELAPRLAKAFPGERQAVLYGGSEQRWEAADLVVATTHQLLRFCEAFDLVIIDELDAFPYHNDPMLAFAAEACCKPSGRFIYLSATPPSALQRESARGKLPHAKVPARFHGHPLPVPARLSGTSVGDCLSKGRLPQRLLRELRQSVQRGAQVFVFVSRIRHIHPLVLLLRRQLSGVPVEGTSSEDDGRSTKVLAFRAGDIRVLVTTTILERGVTVPRSDVYILDAHSDLFDEASLVQMAGRAGRSKEDPAGRVIFFSADWTRSQRGAIRQIRRMNALARKKGFLLSKPERTRKGEAK
ncbi:hypothetical protein DCC85_20140 [Paenibacillus sp. CAA11]|uniref:DEAD/DEAH box helicase n=1 Tax=Paenibacillus sp. CAA11 TaxID=1532905 RepID=UPI000D3D5AA5|nr:helicase-related protein [Paenibacillus sp. CAA11]AWB46243.1 hypothetical protein DCC85_20140 [Paenibacillus sp. CAA11]